MPPHFQVALGHFPVQTSGLQVSGRRHLRVPRYPEEPPRSPEKTSTPRRGSSMLDGYHPPVGCTQAVCLTEHSQAGRPRHLVKSKRDHHPIVGSSLESGRGGICLQVAQSRVGTQLDHEVVERARGCVCPGEKAARIACRGGRRPIMHLGSPPERRPARWPAPVRTTVRRVSRITIGSF